jgi:hypothetical protein
MAGPSARVFDQDDLSPILSDEDAGDLSAAYVHHAKNQSISLIPFQAQPEAIIGSGPVHNQIGDALSGERFSFTTPSASQFFK